MPLPTAAKIRRLRRKDLPADTVELAQYLIGKVLVHDTIDGPISGRIVETEAYPVGDSSGHAFRGQTQRNRSLYLARGHAYVYFIYGTSYMLNVSSESPEIGAGVLLRALEPLQGIALMARGRGITRLTDLARGPGRLAAAMRVDLRFDGTDLCGNEALWLGKSSKNPVTVGTTTRIGITREIERPLRFFEQGSVYVSGPKRLLK
ncbi:MAG: DNA-3-methyladenine glycosylase [Burkholderiales bacterium]|nr:DNA-3-methyladenine glycosylase [Burkholderiales bacterium]